MRQGEAVFVVLVVHREGRTMALTQTVCLTIKKAGVLF